MSRVPPVRPSPPTRTSLKFTIRLAGTRLCRAPPHDALTSASTATSDALSRIRSPKCVVRATTFPTSLRRPQPSPRNLRPPREPLADLLLESEPPRLVEHRAAQAIGKILLRDVCVLGVVRVLIPFVIPQFLHQRRRCVADVQRHALGRRLRAPRRAQRPAPFSRCSISAPSRGRSSSRRAADSPPARRACATRRARRPRAAARSDRRVRRPRRPSRSRDGRSSSDPRRPRSFAPSSRARPVDRCRAATCDKRESMLKCSSPHLSCRAKRSCSASRATAAVMCPFGADVRRRRLEHRERAARVAIGLGRRSPRARRRRSRARDRRARARDPRARVRSTS